MCKHNNYKIKYIFENWNRLEFIFARQARLIFSLFWVLRKVKISVEQPDFEGEHTVPFRVVPLLPVAVHDYRLHRSEIAEYVKFTDEPSSFRWTSLSQTFLFTSLCVSHSTFFVICCFLWADMVVEKSTFISCSLSSVGEHWKIPR